MPLVRMPLGSRSIARVMLLALLAAAAAAAALAIAFARRPSLTFDMAGELPRLVRGFYPTEQHGDETFAWTMARASVSLPGLDRRATWTCAIGYRTARPPGAAAPLVLFGIDGVTRASAAGARRDAEVIVAAPARAAPGLLLTIDTEPDVRAERR